MPYIQNNSIENTENLLTFQESLIKETCETFGGIVRLIVGDEHFITFNDVVSALQAVEVLCNKWEVSDTVDTRNIPMSIGINKGDMNIFRSCIYSDDVNSSARLCSLCQNVKPEGFRNTILVSKSIWEDVSEVTMKRKFRLLTNKDLIKKINPDSHIKQAIEKSEVYEFLLKFFKKKK